MRLNGADICIQLGGADMPSQLQQQFKRAEFSTNVLYSTDGHCIHVRSSSSRYSTVPQNVGHESKMGRNSQGQEDMLHKLPAA